MANRRIDFWIARIKKKKKKKKQYGSIIVTLSCIKKKYKEYPHACERKKIYRHVYCYWELANEMAAETRKKKRKSRTRIRESEDERVEKKKC